MQNKFELDVLNLHNITLNSTTFKSNILLKNKRNLFNIIKVKKKEWSSK